MRVNPEILEAEHRRSRDGGRNVDTEGHMIGGRSSEGGEDSIRKDLVPAKVDEESV
jgi:hypothetical protein